MLLLKNIRLLRTLFVLTVFILFLASCRNKKEIASTNTPKNNTSTTTPKKNETSVKSSYIVDKYATQLKVDKKDKSVKSWKVTQRSGQRLVFKVDKFTPNVKVEDKFFAFDATQYKGVEVIDLR